MIAIDANPILLITLFVRNTTTKKILEALNFIFSLPPSTYVAMPLTFLPPFLDNRISIPTPSDMDSFHHTPLSHTTATTSPICLLLLSVAKPG